MISSPVEALRTAEPDAPLGSSVLFVLIASVVGFGSTMACYALLLVPMMMFGSPGKSAFGSGLLAGSMIFIVAFYAVLLLATQLAGALFLSALEQVGLMLLGAQPKRFTVTVRAHALSMGVYLTGLMPFCSLPVFGLWALGLRIIALQHLHQTTGGKAAGAVLLPLGMLVGGLAAFSFAVIALAMNFSR